MEPVQCCEVLQLRVIMHLSQLSSKQALMSSWATLRIMPSTGSDRPSGLGLRWPAKARGCSCAQLRCLPYPIPFTWPIRAPFHARSRALPPLRHYVPRSCPIPRPDRAPCALLTSLTKKGADLIDTALDAAAEARVAVLAAVLGEAQRLQHDLRVRLLREALQQEVFKFAIFT